MGVLGSQPLNRKIYFYLIGNLKRCQQGVHCLAFDGIPAANGRDLAGGNDKDAEHCNETQTVFLTHTRA